MVCRLEEFASLYDKRPIRDNKGGMRSPHLFLIWYVLQALRPKVIIESGVWLGQGTWFFEQACPEARLYCIDPVLNRIQHRSRRAQYVDRDFSLVDWRRLPKDETVVFFDDHQNAYERLKTAKWFGFKHVVFEDNYPASQGDCYSLKKVFAWSGLKASEAGLRSPKARLYAAVRAMLGRASDSYLEIPPNDVDAKYLEENLDVYQELPPIFKAERTRWGDTWNEVDYPTPEPLLRAVEASYQRRYLDEAADYTWMCYARLK